MKSAPFGLDIGTSHIKAVWLSQGSDGYNLLSALSYPTPAKGIQSESPVDQEEVAQVIHKIITDGKISTHDVHIALSEGQVYTKVLEMPVLSDKELSSAIHWEAEQHIPVPLENVSLDWEVLDRPEKQEAEKMHVLLVGAPTLLVEKYQRIMAMAKLNIVSVETEILSAIRTIVGSGHSPQSIVINIGAHSTAYAVLRNNAIFFTYSVPIGGIAVTRAIAADFGFSLQQAEEYKRVYGVTDKTLGGKIGQSTAPILQSIVNEVKKGIAFYNEKFGADSPISQIILSGGSAKLPGIDLFFVQNCGIETVTANPWAILANQQIPKELVENAPDYTIATGLAMRGYE